MTQTQESIEKIRSFNRFYTNIIGLLDQHFLDTPYSLTEGRVLYEIHTMKECSARKIMENIEIDEGYLSRIINKFAKQGLVRKFPSAKDKRQHMIMLTGKGKREFLALNENSNQLISTLIEKLSVKELEDLTGMMERIHELLGKDRT
ncbi:MAG: MarR family transcriptional regulator [Chloroflexi bacterium]|nr:MAG: MarR family transcriptional regulator [Chloroflexota bacterium]